MKMICALKILSINLQYGILEPWYKVSMYCMWFQGLGTCEL